MRSRNSYTWENGEQESRVFKIQREIVVPSGEKFRFWLVEMALRRAILSLLAIYFGLILLFAAIYSFGGLIVDSNNPTIPERKFISSLYFSTICQTTVGFGDLRPIGPMGQVIVMIQALIGTVSWAVLIGIVLAKLLIPPDPVRFSKYIVFYRDQGVFRGRFQVKSARFVTTVINSMNARILEDGSVYNAQTLPVLRTSYYDVFSEPGKSYLLPTLPLQNYIKAPGLPRDYFNASKASLKVDLPSWEGVSGEELADIVLEANPHLEEMIPIKSHRYMLLTPSNLDDKVTHIYLVASYTLEGLTGSGTQLRSYEVIPNRTILCGRFEKIVERSNNRRELIVALQPDNFDKVEQTTADDCRSCCFRRRCVILKQRVQADVRFAGIAQS